MIWSGHKNITNTTITLADKVMNAIADCVKVVQGFMNSRAKIETRDVKQLVDLTKHAVACNPSNMNDKAH